MPNIQGIKKRIESIKETRKITNAMYLISSTKMRKAKATITDDYQNLKNLVLEKRRAEVLDEWIREKQKHTYVRIKEGWNNCEFKYPGWIKD